MPGRLRPRKGLWHWLRSRTGPAHPASARREALTHVVLLDGTMSRLSHGDETNIGRTYRLLSEVPRRAGLRLHYQPGLQWQGWHSAHEVIAGIGLNRQIQRAYLHLARHYRPGDKIVLMGYSRGAYGVRALAGMIDRVGLLRAAHLDLATRRRLYTLYRNDPEGAAARAMRAALCHPGCQVDFLGAYDTVCPRQPRALLVWPVLPAPPAFRDASLGKAVRIARHALALEETRAAYRPLIWQSDPADAMSGRVRQMWFRGSHGDVGGQLGGLAWARPLANIPLVWMLSEAEAAGLALPMHWRNRFVTDASAPGIGMNRGIGLLFVLRRPRPVGHDLSEALHPSAAALGRALGVTCLRATPL